MGEILVCGYQWLFVIICDYLWSFVIIRDFGNRQVRAGFW